MKFLLKFFFVAFFFGSSLALADGSPHDGKHFGPRLNCEFLLREPYQSNATSRWFRNLINSLESSAPAVRDPSISSEALVALGLPLTAPNLLRMQIDSYPGFPFSYWIRLKTAFGQMRSFSVQVPPIFVWKEMDARHDIESVNFKWNMKGEDLSKLNVGMVLNLFEDGRTFISARVIDEKHVRISAGIDVNLEDEQKGHYDSTQSPLLIVGPSLARVYRRIEVYHADFQVKPDSSFTID